MAGLVESAAMLRASGLPCELVSAGGTGTYDISGRMPGITEIQAGSYVLMDTDYGQLDVPFEQAFWVLGTVISRPEPRRIVVDCGHKSMTKDHGLPSPRDLDGANGGVAQRRARDDPCSARLPSADRRPRLHEAVTHGSDDQPARLVLCPRRGSCRRRLADRRARLPKLTHSFSSQECQKCNTSRHSCRSWEALGVGAY